MGNTIIVWAIALLTAAVIGRVVVTVLFLGDLLGRQPRAARQPLYARLRLRFWVAVMRLQARGTRVRFRTRQFFSWIANRLRAAWSRIGQAGNYSRRLAGTFFAWTRHRLQAARSRAAQAGRSAWRYARMFFAWLRTRIAAAGRWLRNSFRSSPGFRSAVDLVGTLVLTFFFAWGWALLERVMPEFWPKFFVRLLWYSTLVVFWVTLIFGVRRILFLLIRRRVARRFIVNLGAALSDPHVLWLGMTCILIYQFVLMVFHPGPAMVSESSWDFFWYGNYPQKHASYRDLTHFEVSAFFAILFVWLVSTAIFVRNELTQIVHDVMAEIHGRTAPTPTATPAPAAAAAGGTTTTARIPFGQLLSAEMFAEVVGKVIWRVLSEIFGGVASRHLA